jgi:hypothetical protein
MENRYLYSFANTQATIAKLDTREPLEEQKWTNIWIKDALSPNNPVLFGFWMCCIPLKDSRILIFGGDTEGLYGKKYKKEK